jgi:Aerotolerance regulator N-terminal
LTFALSSWLAGLLIAAGAAAAVAVFVIRPRARRQALPSLVIWNRVLGEARQKSFWERVRWAVSLALTALIAAAMGVALARPAPRAGARASGRMLLVLDSSWSMRARTPSGDTRWQRAIEDARAVAGDSSTGEVAIATTAEGIVEGPTADLALIRSVLNRLEPSGAADGAWPTLAGAAAVHFFTDGAVARSTASDVVVHSVFAPAPNVAVTAFGVEPDMAAGSGADVFLAVSNFAPNAQTVHLTVTRGPDILLDRSMPVRAGESHREVMTVPIAGDARFHVHAAAADNALDLDDDAVAWLWEAQPLRVAVVGAASLVPALLAKDATVRVSHVAPADYAKADADVWVFDRWLPPAAPARPALLIDPPPSPWLGARGEAEARPIWRRGAAHRILDGIDDDVVVVGRARPVTRKSLQTIVSSEAGTPLVSVEDTASGRYVVLGFSTEDANFSSTPAFPILVGNAIDWLGRPERGVHRQPGPVSLPAATRRVVAPTGQSLAIVRLDDRVTTTLPAPGLYLAETAGRESVVSVGLGDPGRSNLQVSTVAPDRSRRQPSRAEGRPWWVGAAWAALALVAIEWVTWQRRVTV